MGYREQYMQSFVNTTEKQKKIIRGTLRYRQCELADAVEKVKKEFWEEFGKNFRRVFRGTHAKNILHR